MAVRRTERWFQQLVGGGDVYRRRREYAALREKHNTDPREAGAGDVAANNPLMHTEGSSWAAYFATQEVRKTIALDLERLHPGDQFYSSPDIQAALLDILTVWSLENPSVGYRQGMHELASLVLSQRASDVAGLGHEWGTRASPPRDPVVDGAPELSAAYVEHDAYAMFSAMLGPTRAARAAAPEEKTPIRVVAFFEDAPGKGGFDRSEVKGACDRVFAAVGAVDPHLKQHLERLGIEPQLFLLRWFRVLFSREFHLDDAMRAWSAFFAANKSGVRDVIEAFAAAMVLFLRHELMAADDFGTCLRRLQRFPPVEDIDILIERSARDRARGRRPRKGARPKNADVADAPRGPRQNRRVSVAGDARRVRPFPRPWSRRFGPRARSATDSVDLRRVGRTQEYLRAGHLREGEGRRRGGPRTRRRALGQSRRRDEEFRREFLFGRFGRHQPFLEPRRRSAGGR
jgi:TBC1 domain family protein 5